MLIYHQAFDLYHCMYRLLLLLQNVKGDSIETDKLRVWDYYFLFPTEVAKTAQFPQEIRELRRIFKDDFNPYEDIVDSKRTLKRLEGYQMAALKCLAAYGYIETEDLTKGVVKKTTKTLPEDLLESFKSLSIKEQNVIKLLQSPFNDLGLYGKSGFKARTGLLDFRYDPK